MAGRTARLAVLVSVLGAVFAGSQSATAAEGWTVEPGGGFTGFAQGPEYSMPNAFISCVSSRMEGNFRSGSGLPGAGIGQVTSLSWEGCEVLGITFTIASHDHPYAMNVIDTDPSNSDRVAIEITGVRVTAEGAGCSAELTGFYSGYYENSTHRLNLDGGQLHAVRANCLGVLNPGDVVATQASYVLTPGMTITKD